MPPRRQTCRAVSREMRPSSTPANRRPTLAGIRLIRKPVKGRRPAWPMSTVRASRLESLILEKICALEYVSRIGCIDEGREEVTILAIHDYDPDRLLEMIRGIGDGGRAIEDEIPDRMFSPLSIHDGPDLPEGIIAGSKVIYEWEGEQ